MDALAIRAKATAKKLLFAAPASKISSGVGWVGQGSSGVASHCFLTMFVVQHLARTPLSVMQDFTTEKHLTVKDIMELRRKHGHAPQPPDAFRF